MSSKEALIGKMAEAMADLIMGAVAAERERCATIADDKAKRHEKSSSAFSISEDTWSAVAAKEIATKIRKG